MAELATWPLPWPLSPNDGAARARNARLNSCHPSCGLLYYARMSQCAEIEAAIPSLSAEELARIEATLHRVLRARGLDAPPSDADVRLDGRPWPKTPEEIATLLAELDALPPLLTPE